MAKELRLPELGENIESGDVVSVLVNVGDSVEEGQAVLELETDKATVEVPADASGVVTKILVSEGDTIQVGQAVLTLDEAVEQAPREAEGGEGEADAGQDSGEASDDAEELPEPGTGPGVPAGERQPVADAGESPSPAQAQVVPMGDRRREPSARATSPIVPASPAVRRFAREIGIDIAQVLGTGASGRITREDVKAYARQERKQAAPESAGLPSPPLPDFSKFGEIEREPFTNVRRATARHMAAVWRTVPHVTQYDRADVTELEAVRRKYASRVEAAGGKLTITAIALKLVASALRAFPKFNASIDVDHEEVVYKKYIHIGVAVDTDRGLLVPVIRDVDRKSITDLALELKDVADRARARKTGLEELRGGCFTITNLGGIGGTYFAPIINAPEVAILGISRTSTEPVLIDGDFRPRQILPLSLSYDHRIIDGADGARFLRWLAEAFENPLLSLL